MSVQTGNTLLQWLRGPRLIRTMIAPLGRGIVAREVRSLLPAVASVLLLQVLIILLLLVGSVFRNSRLNAAHMEGLLFLVLVMQGFLCGVQCGAEEEESGTSDMTRRLPLSSTGVMMRKIMGALIALAMGAAGAGLLAGGGGLILGYGHFPRGGLAAIGGGAPIQGYMVALCFAWGLAAGTLMGRVLPAAVVGGLGAALFFSAFQLKRFMPEWGWTDLVVTGFTKSLAIPAALAVAFVCHHARSLGWAPGTAGLGRKSLPLTIPIRIPFLSSRPHASTSPAFGLGWKESNSRRGLMIPLMVAMLVFPLAGMLLDAGGYLHDFTPNGFGAAGGYVAKIYSISILLLGGTLFSREEHDPARGLIFLLPVSRGKLLRVKLLHLAGRFIQITLIFLLVMAMFAVLHRARIEGGWSYAMSPLVPVMILWGIPALILAAILSLHFRGVMMNLITSSLASGPLALLFFMHFLPASGTWVEIPGGRGDSGGLFEIAGSAGVNGLLGEWLLRSSLHSLALTSALLAWLFWLFRRGSIQELGAGARSSYGLLFVATFVEITATLFLVRWRDVAYILLGW